MIKITDAAISKIKKEVKGVKKPFVRLAMGIGWGGPQLRLTLEESALENDEIIEQDGINFLVHETNKPYFNNVKIDYTKTLSVMGNLLSLHHKYIWKKEFFWRSNL